jgi:POT family proton-dependent oligopeptide transporter
VQSINPVFIIILSGVFAGIWTRLGERQPATPYKFAAGTAVMGAAFLLFLPFVGGGANSTPLLAIVGIVFVFTIAELLLSPVGLSVTTKLAPAAFQTQMVALFFLSVALGTAISGQLAALYSERTEGAYFGILGGIAIVLGIALAALTPWVKRLIAPVR